MPRRRTDLQPLQTRVGSDPFDKNQAAAFGIRSQVLEQATTDGLLIRIGRNSYAFPTADPREAHLQRALTLVGRQEGRALAGISAAAAWGLPCPHPWGDWESLPVTIASWTPVKATGAACLRLRAPATTHRGWPVTPLVETAIDVARQLPLPESLIVIDAIARRLVGTNNKQTLATAAARDGSRQRLLLNTQGLRFPGILGVRRSLNAAEPAADSPPESFIRGHILQSSLPPPQVNPPLRGLSGQLYFADLFWPEERRIVEIDGRVKYTDIDVLYAEKRRQDDLESTGLRVTRWTAEDVFTYPDALVASLLR